MVGTARSERSPLASDRGTTTIQDGVVTSIAAVAITETDGVDPSHGGTRLPGDTSPTVGEFVGRFTGGAARQPRHLRRARRAADRAGPDGERIYGGPIHRVTEAVRQNVIRRVEALTGLEVTEVNITVNDVTFPDQ